VMRVIRPARDVYDRLRRDRNGLNFQDLLLLSVRLLRDKPDRTDGEIVAGMNGHLCRCNGYVKIVAAVRRAAATMRAERHG